MEKASAQTLLENLARSRGIALDAVFLPSKDRHKEYALTSATDPYIEFVAKKLVPLVERALAFSGSPDNRLIVGDSLGGPVSLYTALMYPDVFKKVASQLGAFYPDHARVLNLLERARPGMEILLQSGTYEGGSFLSLNREASRICDRNGIAHQYEEFPSIHDWISWRNQLSRPLIQFYSHQPAAASQRLVHFPLELE